MYNRTSLLISIFLLGGITTIVPTAAEAQVLVAQKSTQRVRELLNEGRKLVDAGDYNGAIAIYQQAASLEPKNASIHSGIGYLYAIQNNMRASLAAYKRAVALNPNNGDYQYALGYVSATLGDIKGAKNAYRQAIQANRNHVNAYLGLATILMRQGEYENAGWAYVQLAKLDPRNPQVYELRGNILKKYGKAKEAIAYFKKARDAYAQQGKQDSVARVEAVLKQIGG
ncbi:tetratricopeptide repeat protein [Calothrix sp. 336/3]|uniref:tetratricopeptide repeat protein n=1 Tax=Calothrix sp. 336/3 TaxID=1337936 RepID=UPI0004E3B095|nr:tetratricopeptide repeat protein [Calothrix sp. 336/3]AKG22113.1 hypothetical protein IJ00_13355 [Calothrix sp. 336/3]